jgi:4-amino-4-deoxy-L-arabinose transferase-like glycosyltransferase
VLALAIVAGWVLVPALVNPGQWGDNFEQFIWAHSLEWGYYKHPPLPTWLMGLTIAAFGPSPWWAYVLAGLCTAGTAFFTYRIAAHLLSRHLAGVALLLWGLQQAFSARAQLYNHNTVMMLAISGTAWCVLRGVGSRRTGWWLAAGVGAAAAMLSKYQAIVPLAGIVCALLLTGDLQRPDVRRGLIQAAATAVLLFSPHVAWMLRHDLTTLRYATQEGRVLDWTNRGMSVASFLAQQFRLLFPSLALAGLLWMLPSGRAQGVVLMPKPTQHLWRIRRAWLIGLIAFPLVITLLTCPVFGVRLQNHWGFQCLQFASFWLAWRLRRVSRRPAAVLVGATLALQSASLLVIAAPFSQKPAYEQLHRDDSSYPARRLAMAAVESWKRMTPCPLKLVVGPPFEAGMISVYGDGEQKVLEWGDFGKTPWVSPRELERDGAIYVAEDPGVLPARAVLIDSMALQGSSTAGGIDRRVYWAIVLPSVCSP